MGDLCTVLPPFSEAYRNSDFFRCAETQWLLDSTFYRDPQGILERAALSSMFHGLRKQACAPQAGTSELHSALLGHTWTAGSGGSTEGS